MSKEAKQLDGQCSLEEGVGVLGLFFEHVHVALSVHLVFDFPGTVLWCLEVQVVVLSFTMHLFGVVVVKLLLEQGLDETSDLDVVVDVFVTVLHLVAIAVDVRAISLAVMSAETSLLVVADVAERMLILLLTVHVAELATVEGFVRHLVHRLLHHEVDRVMLLVDHMFVAMATVLVMHHAAQVFVNLIVDTVVIVRLRGDGHLMQGLVILRLSTFPEVGLFI